VRLLLTMDSGVTEGPQGLHFGGGVKKLKTIHTLNFVNHSIIKLNNKSIALMMLVFNFVKHM
jgi:hypothetical protein